MGRLLTFLESFRDAESKENDEGRRNKSQQVCGLRHQVPSFSIVSCQQDGDSPRPDQHTD